jgi:hypothetical protein
MIQKRIYPLNDVEKILKAINDLYQFIGSNSIVAQPRDFKADLRQIQRDEGERLKNEGMQRALFSADRKDPGWPDRAFEQLKKYLEFHGYKEFKSEDMRQWAYKRGLPRPPDERAWGSVIARANKQGIIRFIRHTTYDQPHCHKGYTSLWQKSC